jgi:aryl-alcohol dehydrogenase-like predicted oxidoreductase
MTSTLTIGGNALARIGLGTNRLSRNRNNVAFIRAAFDAGVRHFDTAHLYTSGESEETIGEALAPLFERCVIATKGGFGSGRGDVLRAEIEESLRRLRTDRIALYYLHRVDPQTPLEESLGVIKEYVDAGAIEQVGVSEVNIEQIERAKRVLPIAAVQNRYNLSERRYDDVVDYCAEQQIVFVPFYPLQGAGRRSLTPFAKKLGVTPAQVALAWLLRRSPTMLPIPGTLSLEHLQENLAALEIELSDDDYDALT